MARAAPPEKKALLGRKRALRAAAPPAPTSARAPRAGAAPPRRDTQGARTLLVRREELPSGC